MGLMVDSLQRRRQQQRRGIRQYLMLALCLLATASVSPSAADDFSGKDRFFAQLSTPLTSIQDGKPLREALQSIAGQVQLNLWFDRKVDPTSPIDLGPVGPTVYQAIRKIAEANGCVVMAVSEVVLVGRPQWVDTTAASLIAISTRRSAAAKIDVQWDPLTTPREAYQVIADGGAATGPALPHDLWPAVHWQKIDRRVANALVLAQFDLRPGTSPARPIAATLPASVTRRYPAAAKNQLDGAMRNVDRTSRVRLSNGWTVASGSLSAHRAAVAELLKADARVAANANQVFSLKPTEARVGDLLTKFALTAGRHCKIDPAAIEACEKVITLEATDQTLRQLVDQVATRGGVTATWTETAIIVTTK